MPNRFRVGGRFWVRPQVQTPHVARVEAVPRVCCHHSGNLVFPWFIFIPDESSTVSLYSSDSRVSWTTPGRLRRHETRLAWMEVLAILPVHHAALWHAQLSSEKPTLDELRNIVRQQAYEYSADSTCMTGSIESGIHDRSHSLLVLSITKVCKGCHMLLVLCGL